VTQTTRRADPGYEERRCAAVWNAVVPDRRPDEIAVPAGADEVAGLVARAAAAGQRVAVKSGGHNWFGASLREEGLLLDLGGLRRVEVDVEGRRAVVEPGATHKEVADALVPHGLAFPTGHCPSVGLGGYLLAGGFGWNPRTWGPACWSVTGIDAVTAAGEQVHASSESHPDLFWAARGGGPAFPAVVTRFELRLFELPKIVGRRVPYPLGELPALMEWAAAAVAALPPGIEISLIVRERRVIVAATAFRPSVAEAEELLEQAFRGRDVDDGTPEELAMNELEGDGGWREGLRYWADNCWVGDGLAEVGRAVADAMENAPSPLSRAVLTFADKPGGAEDVALTRLGPNDVNLYATWEDPAGDESNIGWVRQSMVTLAPWISGHYVAESDLRAEAGRPQRCYTPETWDRLQRVAAEYDPDGRFFGFLD
jgi:FAD/FMN-containing dehydrogenase